MLLEDSTNRLDEACNISDAVVNNLVFNSVVCILFLNKIDFLQEKVKKTGIYQSILS